MSSWGEKFAEAADAGARVGWNEGIKLTLQVAEESSGDLTFGADMVLQHYRHPDSMTIETLREAARWKRQDD